MDRNWGDASKDSFLAALVVLEVPTNTKNLLRTDNEGNFGVAEATGKWYGSLSFLGLVACVVIAASTGQMSVRS
jgi:hypothetical protein